MASSGLSYHHLLSLKSLPLFLTYFAASCHSLVPVTRGNHHHAPLSKICQLTSPLWLRIYLTETNIVQKRIYIFHFKRIIFVYLISRAKSTQHLWALPCVRICFWACTCNVIQRALKALVSTPIKTVNPSCLALQGRSFPIFLILFSRHHRNMFLLCPSRFRQEVWNLVCLRASDLDWCMWPIRRHGSL